MCGVQVGFKIWCLGFSEFRVSGLGGQGFGAFGWRISWKRKRAIKCKLVTFQGICLHLRPRSLRLRDLMVWCSRVLGPWGKRFLVFGCGFRGLVWGGPQGFKFGTCLG